LDCGLDPSPGRASIRVDPVVDLVVWGTVALGGPSAGEGASKVPHAALRDAVGNRGEGVVDGGAVGLSRDEDQGALKVDSVEAG
jgi:hypothetical protein